MLMEGNELGELLATENKEYDAIKARVVAVGMSLDPKAEHDLRIGIRTRLLIELGLAKKQNVAMYQKQ